MWEGFYRNGDGDKMVKEAQKRIEFDKGRYWTKKMNGSENKTKDENDDWQGNERCENK